MDRAERAERLAAERVAERLALEKADEVMAAYGEVLEDFKKATPFLLDAVTKLDAISKVFDPRDTGGVRLKRHLRIVGLAKLTKSIVSHLGLTIRVMDSMNANRSSIRTLSIEQSPPFVDV